MSNITFSEFIALIDFFLIFPSIVCIGKKRPFYANDCFSMLMHSSKYNFKSKMNYINVWESQVFKFAYDVHVFFVSYCRNSTISYWLLFRMATFRYKYQKCSMNWIVFFSIRICFELYTQFFLFSVIVFFSWSPHHISTIFY